MLHVYLYDYHIFVMRGIQEDNEEKLNSIIHWIVNTVINYYY
jgi:hypothetical protein